MSHTSNVLGICFGRRRGNPPHEKRVCCMVKAFVVLMFVGIWNRTSLLLHSYDEDESSNSNGGVGEEGVVLYDQRCKGERKLYLSHCKCSHVCVLWMELWGLEIKMYEKWKEMYEFSYLVLSISSLKMKNDRKGRGCESILPQNSSRVLICRMSLTQVGHISANPRLCPTNH
jgi:hypothetical protein